MKNSNRKNRKNFIVAMLWLGFFGLFAGKVDAQECFPTNNAIWVERIEWINFYNSYPIPEPGRVKKVHYALIGDTTINDTIFSKLYDINYNTSFIVENIQNYNFLGWIKQKDQKVWFNDGLLYDFGVSVGDTVGIGILLENSRSNYFPYSHLGNKCCVIKNIVYENGVKKIYTGNDVWIEGMGSIYGIFGNQIEKCLCYDWYEFSLGCFKHNDTIKYISNICNDCYDCPFYYLISQVGVRIHVNDNWEYTDYYFSYSETPIQTSLKASHIPNWLLLNPITYHWSTNSQNYTIEDSTISNPTFSFLGDVSVYVKVTDKLGSVTYDTVNLIMVTENIGEFGISEQISIFPNPTKDKLYIQSSAKIENIQIYDVYGRMLKDIQNSQSVNISDLSQGFYFLKLKTAGKESIYKVTKY